MSRRALASFLTAIGLFLASIAWWGLTLERNLFDPSRTEELVTTLLESETVEDAIVASTLRSIDASLPEAARASVPIESLDTAIRLTLDRPEVSAALQTALVDSHRYAVGELDTAPTLDTVLLDAALRDELGRAAPSIAPIIGTLPTFQITLPDTGLSVVRGVRDSVNRVTALAAMLAVGLLGTAFAIGKPRSRVLRRVAWWAMFTGGMWIALRFGLPAMAEAILPQSASVVKELATVLSSRMLQPGVALAVFGGLLFLCGAAIDFAERRRLARRAEKRRRLAEAATTGEDGGVGGRSLHRPPPSVRRSAAPTPNAGTPTVAPAAPVPTALRNSRMPDAAATGRQVERPAMRPAAEIHAPEQAGVAASPFDLANAAGAAPQAGAAVVPLRPRIRPDGTPEGAAGHAEEPGAGPRLRDPGEMRRGAVARDPAMYSSNPLGDAGSTIPRHLGVRPEPDIGPGPVSRAAVSRPEWAVAPDEPQALSSPPPPPPRWHDQYGYVYEQPPTADALWIDGIGYVLNQGNSH